MPYAGQGGEGLDNSNISSYHLLFLNNNLKDSLTHFPAGADPHHQAFPGGLREGEREGAQSLTSGMGCGPPCARVAFRFGPRGEFSEALAHHQGCPGSPATLGGGVDRSPGVPIQPCRQRVPTRRAADGAVRRDATRLPRGQGRPARATGPACNLRWTSRPWA